MTYSSSTAVIPHKSIGMIRVLRRQGGRGRGMIRVLRHRGGRGRGMPRHLSLPLQLPVQSKFCRNLSPFIPSPFIIALQLVFDSHTPSWIILEIKILVRKPDFDVGVGKSLYRYRNFPGWSIEIRDRDFT